VYGQRTRREAPKRTSTDNAETWLLQLRHLATIIRIIIIIIIIVIGTLKIARKPRHHTLFV